MSGWHWWVLLAVFGVPVAIVYFTPSSYRVRRKPYALHLLGALALSFVGGQLARSGAGSAAATLGLVAMLVSVGWSVYIVRLAAGRAQDAGHSRWLVLLGYVPLVNLVVALLLLFQRSKAQPGPVQA